MGDRRNENLKGDIPECWKGRHLYDFECIFAFYRMKLEVSVKSHVSILFLIGHELFHLVN